MNKSLFFLIISTTILVLSTIVICIAPIINNISGNGWNPSRWKNLNCKLLADEEKKDDVTLDNMQKYRKYKNLCYRQKTMYGLEYSAFILNVILAFVCADLTLLHYLDIGKDFEKKTGLIGLISGIIGFIITLIYVCYSGYIFTNDVAYGILNISTNPSYYNFKIKLYPNGAKYKWDGNNYITISGNDKEDYAENLKYKDLGKKQYNYDVDYYETYQKNIPSSVNEIKNCHIQKDFNPTGLGHIPITSDPSNYCEYLYYPPEISVVNKYIYDRWLTSLILAIIIVACNLALAIFGFLQFKSKEEIAPSSEQTPIVYKK